MEAGLAKQKLYREEVEREIDGSRRRRRGMRTFGEGEAAEKMPRYCASLVGSSTLF
jgi:hypothetical protein